VTIGIPFQPHITDLGNALLRSGYAETSSPVAGDIVDLSGHHAGIYLGNGEMISNHSSTGLFTWKDTPERENSRYGGAITY
jgi:cell wall-associated NlpC family hydrolase